MLRHAYGRGVTGSELHDDVALCLREIAKHADEALVDGLWSNICHQGTVYEATAYAVPFLAAIAAGDVDSSLCNALVNLLGYIALSGSFATNSGSRAGSYGDGVDVLIRESFTRSAGHLAAIETRRADLAAIVQAIDAITAAPSRATYSALLAALGDELGEPPDALG